MTSPSPNATNALKALENSARLQSIISAIEEFDITRSEGWSRLDALSSNTFVEGVEPSPSGIFEVAGTNDFEVIGDVYVTLNYGGKNDSLSMGDSFPFHAFGRFEAKNKAIIEHFKVDTTAFYE